MFHHKSVNNFRIHCAPQHPTSPPQAQKLKKSPGKIGLRVGIFRYIAGVRNKLAIKKVTMQINWKLVRDKPQDVKML